MKGCARNKSFKRKSCKRKSSTRRKVTRRSKRGGAPIRTPEDKPGCEDDQIKFSDRLILEKNERIIELFNALNNKSPQTYNDLVASLNGIINSPIKREFLKYAKPDYNVENLDTIKENFAKNIYDSFMKTIKTNDLNNCYDYKFLNEKLDQYPPD